MKMSFRWYGKKDPVSLEEIKAIPGMQRDCHSSIRCASWSSMAVRKYFRIEKNGGRRWS